jgi:hypothetical protein
MTSEFTLDSFVYFKIEYRICYLYHKIYSNVTCKLLPICTYFICMYLKYENILESEFCSTHTHDASLCYCKSYFFKVKIRKKLKLNWHDKLRILINVPKA